MHVRTSATFALGASLLFATGCKKTADNTANYKTAINNYLGTNLSCLWPEPQKFPAQVNTDSPATAGFDALYNQGLLVRTTAEKKRLLGLMDKQVTNYDLSPKGKGAWTASQTDPGTGNFCYGHREVSSIDNVSATGAEPGATASVAYHYTFTSTPDWAKDGGVQNAFPGVARNLAGGSTVATLKDTLNGWVVQASGGSAAKSDGTVVQ